MRLTSLTLGFLSIATCITAQGPANQTCRCMPGDECWPDASAWSAFNDTLGGKLIATIPYSSPCHNQDYNDYNSTTCANIQSTFFFPEPHIEYPSSVTASFFTNGTCDPWAPQGQACSIGNYVSYSVNASGPEDFQKTINFTTQNNIRLVIKNTGHDYNGKGTGAGGVAIWTHNMKSLDLISNYTSPNYTGNAVRVGAGIQVYELYKYTHDNGLLAVGGLCPTVGVAGGYAQGGGHGPLVSKYGMGADNVLEWEVVTGNGEFMVATPYNNSDLYWALSGGGGGTFGVVSAMVYKAYPDVPTSAANLTFSMVGNEDSFWQVVQVFQESLPALVDTGSYALWYVDNGNFSVMPALGPGVSTDELQNLMNPTLAALNSTNITYTYMIQQFSNYLDCYDTFVAPWNVSQSLIGGRLIPRSVVENNSTALVAAIKNITAYAGATISGVCVNVSQGVPSPDTNAVNPYWRQSIYDAVVGVDVNYTDWSMNQVGQDYITNTIMPQLEDLTPNGGAYLNEADFQQPDYKSVFYGDHYATLSVIKEKYDPNEIFYAITAIGSDGWYEDQSDGGRLCRAT